MVRTLIEVLRCPSRHDALPRFAPHTLHAHPKEVLTKVRGQIQGARILWQLHCQSRHDW